MARVTLALAAALAAASLLALAAAPASAADAPGKCPPGCATCVPYTPEELAAIKAAYQARKAERAAAKGADAADGGSGWGARGNWTYGNWTKQKCLTCKDETYQLKKGHCACVPGYGLPMPDPSKWKAGERPSGPPPSCARCPAGTASGPDAPQPDWAALKAKWQAARAGASAGGRKLLAAAGKHGKGMFVTCMPCPGGKSNDARTACL